MMLRRFFVLLFNLGSLAATLQPGFSQEIRATRNGTSLDYDWTLIYYMSYDNNLESCGPLILDGLERGVKNTKLVATVLADDWEKKGLKRYVITSAGRTVKRLDTDNSASEKVLNDYLAWVKLTFPSKHYAITFLNHGGGLDDMCLDEWPGENTQKSWLSARLVGPILHKFRRESPGEVDLIFLQQCGRGTLENLYNFRGSAVSILASQMTVGAPNTYYEPTLKWLADHPNTSGTQIAHSIMSNDLHYRIYVCVDGEALSELPQRLNPVIESLQSAGKPALNFPTEVTPCYIGGNDEDYDVLDWLGAAFRRNNRPTQALGTFEEWLSHKLIVKTTLGPDSRKRAENLCGLALFVPKGPDDVDRYRDYPLYQVCRLGSFWKAAYPTKNRPLKGSLTGP